MVGKKISKAVSFGFWSPWPILGIVVVLLSKSFLTNPSGPYS